MRKTCFDLIYELAKEDKRIVYIGSDVGAGTLQKMKEEMPDQFFMEGIQEQSIIGMAAGLALSGKIVYVNTLACFITRRCYEQVYLDLGVHNANVRLLGNGGGLVYAPLGPTHVATDDIALMRNVPNMTVIAPADANEMTQLMPQTVDHQGPIYIRFAKGGDPLLPEHKFEMGKSVVLKEGSRGLVISTGVTTQIAMEVDNISVMHCPTIKQLDYFSIFNHIQKHRSNVVIEEHSLAGGLGSAIAQIGYPVKYIGLPDVVMDRYGSQESQLAYYGITKEAIENAIG